MGWADSGSDAGAGSAVPTRTMAPRALAVDPVNGAGISDNGGDVVLYGRSSAAPWASNGAAPGTSSGTGTG